MPTLGERAFAFFAPMVALMRSTATRSETVSTAEPMAAPQPSSVVDFDFDNDGKADIGRWHSANSELKVKNSNGGSESFFTVG
ncbi:MAG: hypothetical protein DMF63_04305 [Acidobacteria bacterium]|nr:MAG: hypothetical protein DMF63_04305 [Acidobacteriota bacterium]